MEKRASAVEFNDEKIDQRNGEYDACFKRQSIERTERRKLFNETIKTKRKRERERDPRQATVDDGQVNHADCSDANRNPLSGTKALTQKDNAEQYTEKGIDEITETRLNDETRIDTPYID